MHSILGKNAHFPRLLVLVLSGFAIAAYLVATITADQGQVLYAQYVAAFTQCNEVVVASGAQTLDCAEAADVSAALRAHRKAYSIGEPFLNMALTLNALIFASPLAFRLAVYCQRYLPGPVPPPLESAGGQQL